MAYRTPHRVTVTEVRPVDKYERMASATTADGTQLKVLEVRVGVDLWRVKRRYLVEEAFQTVREGTVEACVEAYNRLS